MICDLDGDGLDDLVLMDDLNLAISYQNSKGGFAREPQQSHNLEPRPCVVWTAKLGKPAGSLLVVTSDGVNELSFTNRTAPLVVRQIIKQPTIVPDATEDTNAMCLSLSVATGRDWPLLLVPAVDGLQVWQHRDAWRQAQLIGNSIHARMRPLVTNPGYSTSFGFDFSVGDVNGDGRDDLIVSRSDVVRSNIFSLYLQQTNGLFGLEPALAYADKVELLSWHCWADLNRDGKVDLIKTACLMEPSFVPGVPSAKVLVSTYIADEHARIPAEPQQVFRKNDFKAALPVVDVDGDGFLDLVLANRHMDSREDVTKIITVKQLDYSYRFHFYRPGTGFPKESDCQRDVVFHLDQAEFLRWIGNENYELFVKLAGDFSGDGKTDLLVREHDNEIAVYFFTSRENGFSLKPDLRFSCPEQIDAWEAKDLNHDGVSDLIVRLRKQNAWRIFISQK